MDAEDLKKRTKQFALRILKLVAALPDTVIRWAIGGQLVRAGTSVGATIERLISKQRANRQSAIDNRQ